MRRALYILALSLFLISGAANAQTDDVLTVDLAQGSVDITTGFDGAELVLFGVKETPGDLAIVITGPARTMVVRHKEEVAGIWMNRDAVRFDNVPVYYDFALSVPAQDLAPPEALQTAGIGINAFDFIHTGREPQAAVDRFREALIRNKQAQGHYPLESEQIIFLSEDFFRTSFYLPADVPTGHYRIHSYLFREGEIVDHRETRLRVAQIGFSARIYKFAHQTPWRYGFTVIILAILAGAAAYVFLKRK